MNKNLIIWSTIIFLFIFLIVFSVAKNNKNNYDGFAKCLKEKETKMYGAFWCGHCKKQKEMFGDSFKHLNYIECSFPDKSGQTEICIQEKIMSYPTWEFSNGERFEGVMSLKQLNIKTGCELNS